MAGFNLIAQLQLQAPNNLDRVVGQIKNSVKNITADIDVRINPGSSANLKGLNQQINILNSSLKQLQSNAVAASAALTGLSRGFGNFGSASNNSVKSLQNVMTATKKLSEATKEATNSSEEFGRTAGLAGRRFAGFSLVAGSVVATVSAIKNGVAEALKFEREFIKISQLGGVTKNDLGELNKEITKLSTNLGVSSKDLIATSVTLRQAGLSVKDVTSALEVLAKTTLAPSFGDIKETTEGAIAIMAQFRIEAKNLEGALASANAVANAFAVESKDIITAVQRSGGAFRSVGGDLNEFIALFTSVRSTTRESAETVATGLRTIFTRLQRRDTVEALKELGINLRATREEALALGQADLENQFVGGYEAVRRLSEGLKGLRTTDPRYSEVIEQLGGYRQISKVIPLIQEFAQSQKALNIAQSGFVSITTASEEAQTTFVVRLQKVKEEFLALARTIVGSNAFKGFLDTTLSLANAFIKITDALSPLIPLLTAFAAVKVGTGLASFFGGVRQGLSGVAPTKLARGGVVPGQGSGDTVPAMLTPGEFVMKKSSAQAIGYGQLHNMNKYAAGGPVKFKVGDYDLSENNLKFMYQLANAKDGGASLIGKNQDTLKRLFGNPDTKSGNYEQAKDIFKKVGFPGQNLTEFRKTLEANKSFVATRKEAIKTGNYVNGGNLTIPFAGETMGYVASGTPGGEAGKQGRDSLNAGLRLEKLNIKNLGEKTNRTAKALLKESGVETITGGVNVHVLGSQPTQDFSSRIVGLVEKNIQSVFEGEFGAGRVQPLNRAQSNTIAGYMFEKYVEGVSGRFTQGNEANFEYIKQKPGSTLGKAFDKFVFPSPVQETYLDLKSRFQRDHTGDVMKKYLNTKSNDGTLAALLGVKGTAQDTAGLSAGKGASPANTLRLATGGKVPGSGNGDTVPAVLTPGEFVIKKSSAQAIGYGNLQNINKYAKGGLVMDIGKPGDFGGLFLDRPEKGGASTDPIANYPLGNVSLDNANALLGKTRDRGIRDEIRNALGIKGQANLQLQIGGKDGFNIYDTNTRSNLSTTVPVSLRGYPDIHLLNPYYSDNFSKSVAPRIADLGEKSTVDLLEGTGLPSNKASKKARQAILKIGERGVLGYAFEAGLLGLTSTATDIASRDSKSRFDITGGNKTKLGHLFNPVPRANALDVKAGLNGANKTSLTGKAASLAAAGEISSGINIAASDLSNIRASLQAELEAKKTGNKIDINPAKPTVKKAAGGTSGSTDTVPAMLTPGEFVINKASASRIGSAALHQMNQTGKIQGYAKGGEVQYFESGGRAERREEERRARQRLKDIEEKNRELDAREAREFDRRSIKNKSERIPEDLGQRVSADTYTPPSNLFATKTGRPSLANEPPKTYGFLNSNFSSEQSRNSTSVGSGYNINKTYSPPGSGIDSRPFYRDYQSIANRGRDLVSERNRVQTLEQTPINVSNLEKLNSELKVLSKLFLDVQTAAKKAGISVNPLTQVDYSGSIKSGYKVNSVVPGDYEQALIKRKFEGSFPVNIKNTNVETDTLGRISEFGKQTVKERDELRKRLKDPLNTDKAFDASRLKSVEESLAKQKRMFDDILQTAKKTGVALAPDTVVSRRFTKFDINNPNLGQRYVETTGLEEGPESRARRRLKRLETIGKDFVPHNEAPLDADRNGKLRSGFSEFFLGSKERDEDGNQKKGNLASRIGQRVQGTGLIALSLGAGYAGQLFENKQTDYDTAASNASAADRVRSNAGAGGALTGAAAGAAFGSAFGPLGTVIGGVAGGLFGFSSSVKDAEKEIRSAKIGKAVTDLSESIQKAIKNNDPLNGALRASLIGNISTIRDEASGKARLESTNSSILGFSSLNPFSDSKAGLDVSKYSANVDKELRQSLGKELPAIFEILNRESKLLGENFAKNNTDLENLPFDEVKKRLEELDKNFIEANRDLLEPIAQFKKVSITEAAKYFRRSSLEGFTDARRQNIDTKTGIDVGQQLNSFARLAAAAENAAVSMTKLYVSSNTLSDLFDGNFSSSNLITKFNLGALTGGSSREDFNSAIGGVRAIGGDGLANYATAFDEIKSNLNAALLNVLGSNELKADDIGIRIREGLTSALTGGARKLNPQEEAIVAGISNQAGSIPIEELRVQGRTDINKLIEKLVGSVNPSESLGKILESLSQNAERYTNELGKQSNRLKVIGESEDKLRSLQLARLRNDVEQRARANVTPGSAIDNLSLTQLNAPISGRMRALTGLGNVPGLGDLSENPNVINNQLVKVQKEILELTEKNKEVKDGFRGDESKAAAERLAKLKLEASNLGTALRELTDTTTRNAAAQEKLNAIQQDRSSRLAFGEKFLTSSGQERGEINKGLSLTNLAARQGNLNGFSSENIKRIFETLNSLGNAKLTGFGGIRANDLKTKLVQSTFGGVFDVDGASKKEEVDLNKVISENFAKAERAQTLYINNQKTISEKLIEDLRDLQKEFFKKLDENIKNEEIKKIKQKITDDTLELGKLKQGRGQQASFLNNLGVTKDSEVDFLRDNKDINELRNVQKRLSELQGISSDAINNVSGFQTGAFYNIDKEGKRTSADIVDNSEYKSRITDFLKKQNLGLSDNELGTAADKIFSQSTYNRPGSQNSSFLSLDFDKTIKRIIGDITNSRKEDLISSRDKTRDRILGSGKVDNATLSKILGLDEAGFTKFNAALAEFDSKKPLSKFADEVKKFEKSILESQQRINTITSDKTLVVGIARLLIGIVTGVGAASKPTVAPANPNKPILPQNAIGITNKPEPGPGIVVIDTKPPIFAEDIDGRKPSPKPGFSPGIRKPIIGNIGVAGIGKPYEPTINPNIGVATKPGIIKPGPIINEQPGLPGLDFQNPLIPIGPRPIEAPAPRPVVINEAPAPRPVVINEAPAPRPVVGEAQVQGLVKSFNGFDSSVLSMQSVLNIFSSTVSVLEKAMNTFPSTLKGEFTHTVNVNVTGAEALAAISPELERLVVDKSRSVLNNYIKNNIPEAGLLT